MNPTFGTLNSTIAKIIAENTPSHSKLVEPFGDGGTIALYLKRKKSPEHLVNIMDEELFNAMVFAQGMSGGDRSRLKGLDWIGSQETFDKVAAISATEGGDFFYRYLYLKHFGLRQKDKEAPPAFDIMEIGVDKKKILYGLPLMKVGLKGVTITNEESIPVMNANMGAFLVLLPKKPEDVEAVRSKLVSISGQFFFTAKVTDTGEVIELAKQLTNLNVTIFASAGIMMSNMSTVWNYEGRLEPLSEEILLAY